MKTLKELVLLTILGLSIGCASLVFVSERNAPPQIYKMRSSGGSQINISNNNFTDHFPEVSPKDEKLAFTSVRPNVSGEQIWTMDLDGGNPQQITSGNWMAMRPRFSPKLMIAFTHPPANAKLWLMRDGTVSPVTNPAPNESDSGGHDFWDDGKMLVFSRNGDLYAIYFDGSQSFQQITNTPTIRETNPVVSHDGKLLAYIVSIQLAPATFDAIQVVSVGAWTPVRLIVMQPPVEMGSISSIAFSRNDKRLYVAARATDVPGTVGKNKIEIFSIKLDGTDQERLTNNQVPDYQPDAILCYSWLCRLFSGIFGD